MNFLKGNIFWAVLILGIFVGVFVGKCLGKREAKDIYIDNPQMIKEIAQLSVLEVSGTAEINESNVSDKAGLWDDIKNYFGEKTIHLNIPYQAKYGSDLGAKDMRITKNGNNSILIEMEKPKLLSFEMRLDKLTELTKNGVFIFQKDNRLKLPIEKLYKQTKEKLEKNEDNLNKSKNKISEVLSKFFQPSGIKPEIKFVQ